MFQLLVIGILTLLTLGAALSFGSRGCEFSHGSFRLQVYLLAISTSLAC